MADILMMPDVHKKGFEDSRNVVELYLNGTRTFKLTDRFLVKNVWDDVRNHQKKCTKIRTWGTLVIRVQSFVLFMTSLHLIYDGAP